MEYFCLKIFRSHSSVTGCQRSRCWVRGQGSVLVRQTGRPPVSSCQPLCHLLAGVKQYLVKLSAQHVLPDRGACPVTIKQSRQYFSVLTVLCGDDYQLIVMDHGLAKTTLARQRQFSTGDTDRPKYSDRDPIGHHSRSISKFGLFVLSSPVNRLSRVRPMKHYQARERSTGAEGQATNVRNCFYNIQA